MFVRLLLPLLAALCCAAQAAPDGEAARVERLLRQVIPPLMAANQVPGMSVAVTHAGRRHVHHFGLASTADERPVTDATLFEIGSLGKPLTATLGAHAQERGKLALADPASRYLPALAGSAFDRVSLLQLATYTAGGLPLQFPDAVKGEDGMVAFYRGWQPAHAAGTRRLYSNPSIGLFGELAARALGQPFDVLMERELFPALGMAHTFIRVPAARGADYAWGYAKDGKPVRVNPGVLDAQAYGVKTTAADLLRFVEAHMPGASVDPALGRALRATRTGYYTVDGMTQGLGWEMYAYPASLDTLLAGNSTAMALRPHAVRQLLPVRVADGELLVNKTGSTNGFGAYAAFVPSRRIGVVLLANRNYPNAEWVRAAHRILQALAASPAR